MMTAQKSFHNNAVTVNKMFASDRLLKNVLRCMAACLEKHCQQDTVMGALWLYDASTDLLTKKITTSLSDKLIDLTETIAISPYTGPVGAASFFQKNILIPDIEHDPLLREKRHIALMRGFRSYIAIPLLSSDQQLIGTIELYSTQLGNPSPRALQAIELFKHLAISIIDEIEQQVTHNSLCSCGNYSL